MIIDPTHDAICNPQVGDRFEEFYTYWVYVVKITERRVWTISGSRASGFPTNRTLTRYSKEKFREHFSYKSPDLINKYWITLCDRGNDVEGWLNDN